ncbi:MAG TPA: sensor histidine kinase [Candidatus Acidoferrum sp.]|nr:sensor histidine kinase [Candidatus Acidoferrum sp.]
MPASAASSLDSQSKEHARKVRALLFVSFGWLLTLLIGAGVDALFSLRQLDTVEQQVSRRFSARSQALSTIVVSVHVYDDQLEHFLLQDQLPAPNSNPNMIAKKIAEIRDALLRFPPDQFPEEQVLLAEMQNLLSDQQNSFATILTWDPEARQQRAQQFIGEQLLPWRARILEISQQISSVDGDRLADENLALALRFQSMEDRLVWLVALALIAGVLMSLICGWYILRLERQGRQRYQALARSRLELEALSARLVQAQEEERRSISRELHDEVGQSLGALLVEVGQLSKLVPSEDRVTQVQITHIKSVAESAVKSIRDIALLLRPPMLDDLGLVPALEWQAREISRRSDMEVEVHSQSVSEDLGDETKVTIYRLVQEALNNAATHASAKNAMVTVVQGPDKITVGVADDGDGFDPGRKRGMGILGMEERVRRLGGAFTIQSTPGKGATVTAELPLRPVESLVNQP